MTWAYKDYRPLKVANKRAEYAHHLKKRVLEKEGKRKKVEAQLETQGVELEGARADLAATPAEVARLTIEGSKY